mgnify:CR=1 FL=1
MSIYYNQQKDMLCIKELYSDICDATNDTNLFFAKLRPILQQYFPKKETEITLINFMCVQKYMFPGEFLNSKNDNTKIINFIVQLGLNTDDATKLFDNMLEIANNSLIPSVIIDTDPTTDE